MFKILYFKNIFKRFEKTQNVVHVTKEKYEAT